MRLSFIFELLLIFLLLAFAASRVIDTKGMHKIHTKTLTRKHGKINHKVRQEENINKYCSCNTKLCNCCREFDIPVVSLKGPGCASLQYLNGDKLAISMSFGDRVLTNTTINSRRPRPICMPLPGGVSKFCGRVYNIGRQGQDFNACLGLELKALKDVEASLRVSCFRFGPQGLKVQPSQPLPAVEQSTDDEDDDDDDDDYDDEDEFGFDDDDDDDEEDDDDDNDVESTDYETFSLLDDDFIDGLFTSEGDDGESVPVKKVTTTTKAPLRRVTKKPLRRVTQKPLRRVTKKPVTITSTTNKIKIAEVTKATTEAPVMAIITSATVVQSEKKPEIIIPITNMSINEISDSTFDDTAISEQDSIVVVSTMLDTAAPQVPSTMEPSSNPLPEPVNISSEPIKKIELTEVVTSMVMDTTSSPQVEPQTSTELSEEIQGTQSATVVEDADTTIDEKIATTEPGLVDEEEEENDEAVQSFIIKNDDDEDDDEEEDESEESDPISEVVEDVLGVEDEKSGKKKGVSKVEKINGDKKGEEETQASAESKDVVDDIIDGTVDMISLTDDSDEDATTKDKADNKEGSDEDDFLGDDDDDDDEDEGEDDDDEDDEEDEARDAKSAGHRKGMKGAKRQTRDMWLDRLHW